MGYRWDLHTIKPVDIFYTSLRQLFFCVEPVLYKTLLRETKHTFF